MGGWTGAFAAAVAAGVLSLPTGAGAQGVARTPPTDTSAAERALTALRGAWIGELDQLKATARALATARDCAEFVARPNLPYVDANFGRPQLAAARIDTVLIVNRSGHPLFWRRVDGSRNRGFSDAEAFLAELPRLQRSGAAGLPSLAGAADLTHGPTLVVAMPIAVRAGQDDVTGWLIVARALDNAQWRRYAELAQVAARVIDRVAWPGELRDALDRPLAPVIRVASGNIEGFLAVPDLRGNSFRAFAVAVPRPIVASQPHASGLSRYLSVWLPLALIVGCGVAATPIVLRRRTRANTGTRRKALPDMPPATAMPDPIAQGVDMSASPSTTEPRVPAGAPADGVAAPSDARAPVDPVGSGNPDPEPAPDLPADPTAARRERLRAALIAIDIVFRYQPQVDLLTGRVAGVESLVFLKGSPDERPPPSLVRQLEAAGLGLPLAERWLQDICAERRLWRREIGHEFPTGMPVSQQTLEDPRFLPLVRATLAAYEVPAHLLELEVPESALDGSAAAARSLAQLQEAGVMIAIDGFDGSHTRLQSLAGLPVTKLRVDAALIDSAGGAAGRARIFEATIGVARGLAIPVCATGVESPALMAAAERGGCLLAQGSAVGRPADGEQFLSLVRGSGVDTATLPFLEVQEGLRRASEMAPA